MMYACLEGHLMANLFRERFVLPTGQLLGKYIAQRQKEGAFRKTDSKVAVMFALSSFVQYAMSRHVFGFKGPPRGDEAVSGELAGLILAAFSIPGAPLAAAPRAAANRAAKKNQKGIHAKS
jgi:hypothetical protein